MSGQRSDPHTRPVQAAIPTSVIVDGVLLEGISDGELSDGLTACLGTTCRVVARATLQRRVTAGRGRAVEVVTLQSGQKVVAKYRNDRAECREALFYRHLLHRASGLVPGYRGEATTASGWHILVLEPVEGRTADWSRSGDRARALSALARFHAMFEAGHVEELLRPPVPPVLWAEATPDPIDPEGLSRAYFEAIRTVRSALPPSMADRLMQAGDDVVGAIVAEPLVLDPGDVRPENVLLLPHRAVLLDFENIGIRRRSIAIAAVLINVRGALSTLEPYETELLRRSRFQCAPAAFHRLVRAARLWLLLRSLGGTVGTPGASSECVYRAREEVVSELMEFSRFGE